MIQHGRFNDGTFVLHKIELNGHKYSAWYSKDGEPFSAELVQRDGNTRSVSVRSKEVWRQLATIGRQYAGAGR